MQERIQRTVIIVIAAVIALLIVVTIPWHMDEFVAYHALACWQHAQQLNFYRLSCSGYPTEIFGFKYQRSYTYIGISSSLLFSPFYFAFHSLYSHYIVGFLSATVVGAGIKKSFNFSRDQALALFLYFPVVFTFLHSNGPERIGLMVIAWSPYLIQRFVLSAGGRKFPWGVILIALWCLAVEDKPFFIFLFPGLLSLTVASFFAVDILGIARMKWKNLTQLVLCGLFAVFSELLLMQANGVSYARFLAHDWRYDTILNQKSGLAQMVLGPVRRLLVGLLFAFDWPYYSHRTTDFEHLSEASKNPVVQVIAQYLPIGSSTIVILSLVLTLLVSFTVIWLIAKSIKPLFVSKFQRQNAILFALLVSFIIFQGSIAISGGWALHHFIYAQIPLFILLTIGYSRLALPKFGLHWLFAFLSCVSLVSIGLLPTQIKVSSEIDEIFNQAIELSHPDDVINCGSWGCYATYSLLNKGDRSVTYAETDGEIDRLQISVFQKNVRVFHLCMNCDIGIVQSLYVGQSVNEVDTGTKDWHLFEVSKND